MTPGKAHPQEKYYIVNDTLITAIGEWDKGPHDIEKILSLLRACPCAIYTSAGSQQRIEQVIKELVDLEAKSLSTCDTAFGYREGLKIAIALLREVPR